MGDLEMDNLAGDELGNQARGTTSNGTNSNGANPSGTGHTWPFVLKPIWIHDLLLLWRRKEPYEPYLEQVSDYSVREVRDKAARRQCVRWIASHFAPSRAAATLTQNVWASYSHHFRATDLAPAYLAHLIVSEPLARAFCHALHKQLAPGGTVARTLLNNVQAAPGALESLLRTLQQWDVLVADPRKGGYMLDRHLTVAPQIFPLLVWVWWLEARQPHIAVDEFAALPLWACTECATFAEGWQGYVGRLWTLETDGGQPTIFLHAADPAAFTRSLLNLLSADGRRGRQLPRHDERDENRANNNSGNRAAARLMREGILGR